MPELENVVTLSRENDPKCPFKPHEYVVIKAEMSFGDDIAIQNHAMKLSGGKAQEVQVMVGNVKLASLQQMLVGWNLTRTLTDPASGVSREESLPFSPQNIMKLSRRYSTYILDKIDELNPTEDEEEEADFLPAAAGSTAGSFDEMKVLRRRP